MSTLKQRFSELVLERPEITQADLARATGAKPPSVNAWFTGASKSMKSGTAVKAAALYGVSPMWLATGDGYKKPTQAQDTPAHTDSGTAQQPTTPNAGPSNEAIMLGTMLDTIKDPLRRLEVMSACVNLIVLAAPQPAPKPAQALPDAVETSAAKSHT